MTLISPVRNDADLHGILKLQRANLRKALTTEEIQNQGFVTLRHSFAGLARLNALEKHVVALDGETVVGYVLAMTAKSRSELPLLEPMFVLFDTIEYHGKPVSNYPYLVVGQVCVDKNYRGDGLFDRLYTAYRELYTGKYTFAITEIAAENTRSRRAHMRVGFEEIATYTAVNGVDWVVVVWNWNFKSIN